MLLQICPHYYKNGFISSSFLLFNLSIIYVNMHKIHSFWFIKKDINTYRLEEFKECAIFSNFIFNLIKVDFSLINSQKGRFTPILIELTSLDLDYPIDQCPM